MALIIFFKIICLTEHLNKIGTKTCWMLGSCNGHYVFGTCSLFIFGVIHNGKQLKIQSLLGYA